MCLPLVPQAGVSHGCGLTREPRNPHSHASRAGRRSRSSSPRADLTPSAPKCVGVCVTCVLHVCG